MIDKFLDIKSIDPEYWGKSGWIFINSVALTYKPENKEAYKQFILQLPIILPCKTCGENLRKNLSTLDDALSSKESLINWFIGVRNSIYRDNNTPWKQKNIKQTFDEIFYLHKNNFNIYWWIFFSVLLLIILLYLFISLKILNVG
jgi:hypothetical protein